jgi:hypothetical protein
MTSHRSLASLVAFALACGPGSPGDTAASTLGTTTLSTGGPYASSTGADPTSTSSGGSTTPTSGCNSLEIFHPGELWSDEAPELTCGAAELCPGEDPIVFALVGEGLLDGDFLSPSSAETDIPRARCLAAALRDRTPGQFLLLPVQGNEVLHIFAREIVGDLAVERTDRAGCELIAPEPESCYVHERLRELRPPEFFATCIEGDALALWLCLYDAFEPESACVAGPLSCP